mmetsp:Transcript_46770/g.125037  ORF Transcript_46770/g.125037 Transcript_46770/m.125037 type:complete len:300 (+) Transcript_46770:418-1317(+)
MQSLRGAGTGGGGGGGGGGGEGGGRPAHRSPGGRAQEQRGQQGAAALTPSGARRPASGTRSRRRGRADPTVRRQPDRQRSPCTCSLPRLTGRRQTRISRLRPPWSRRTRHRRPCTKRRGSRPGGRTQQNTCGPRSCPTGSKRPARARRRRARRRTARARWPAGSAAAAAQTRAPCARGRWARSASLQSPRQGLAAPRKAPARPSGLGPGCRRRPRRRGLLAPRRRRRCPAVNLSGLSARRARARASRTPARSGRRCRPPAPARGACRSANACSSPSSGTPCGRSVRASWKRTRRRPWPR